ncbi:MAG: hypothetical protein OIF50_03720 [Flavobacteriaceae bacterium]|nr:hypothetical protein [Flavobacteriaceae bacterium]
MEGKSDNSVVQEILRKNRLDEARSNMSLASVVFWFIGVVYLFIGFFAYKEMGRFAEIQFIGEKMAALFMWIAWIAFIVAIIFGVLGLLVPKYPKTSILIGLVLVLFNIGLSVYLSRGKNLFQLSFVLELLSLIGICLAYYFYFQYKKLLQEDKVVGG